MTYLAEAPYMRDRPVDPSDRRLDPPDIDAEAAHVARVYDYLLGGYSHFAVDRRAAEHLAAALPGGLETARRDARAQRDLLRRVVRYLAGEAGLHQFLDIGTGIPRSDNVHAVALDHSPTCRTVYVDNDPIVLAHAHTLVNSDAATTSFVDGDLRTPDAVLAEAAATLDLDEPVGLVLTGTLHVIPDEDDPHGIVGDLVEALPRGSHLVVSHLTGDRDTETMQDMARRSGAMMREPFVLRSHDEVARFFDDLEIVPPGLVEAGHWGRDDGEVPADVWSTPIWVGVGRKR
jgi:hypothetical protein